MTLPGNPTFAISRILYRNPETFSRRNMIRLAANPPLLGRIRETVIGSPLASNRRPRDGRAAAERHHLRKSNAGNHHRRLCIFR